MPSEAPLVSVRDLHVRFGARGRNAGVHAVRGVSFDIQPRETLALVGESGSGKTTTGRALLGLSPVTQGSVMLRGQDVSAARGRTLRSIRRDVQLIHQNPYESLTPHLSVHRLVEEPMRVHKLHGSAEERSVRVRHLLELVRLPERTWRSHPRALSGGQLQRVAIARALALEPAVLVADEPVAKLDVSIQAQVVNLLGDLQTELGTSCLFITHNLALTRYVAHRIAIMYRGELVESGPVEQVLTQPQHEYTVELLDAVPRLHTAARGAAGESGPASAG